MPNADLPTELISVDLRDGLIAQVEVTETEREQVRAGILPFDSVGKAIAKVPQVIVRGITIQNTKLEMEFNLT